MDWIDSFMEYTEGKPTPEIFRLWSGISAVAGALERRCWTQLRPGPIFPNMFVLLMALPAVGKGQAINAARDMWASTKGKLKLAADGVSKASFLDDLEAAAVKLPTNNGLGLMEYHALCVSASEFGTLLPKHDTEFLNVLNKIYDHEPSFRDSKRHSKNVELTNPIVTILGGTQPAFLASILPEEAWGMGFMSRMIMIYAQTSPEIDIWDTAVEKEGDTTKRGALITGMNRFTNMVGAYDYEPEVKEAISKWIKTGMEPIPEHTKLQHYNGRRLLTFIKLCMVSSASRGKIMTVNMVDFERAKAWLLQAEYYMPDVFKEMVHQSDGQVIMDLHFFMWQIYVKDKKPLHEARLINFLSNRVPTDRIIRVIEIAVRSNILNQLAGSQMYSPNPKTSWGIV